MPDRMAENLIMFVRRNGGKLSKRCREREFAKLTEKEVVPVEQSINAAYEGYRGE